MFIPVDRNEDGTCRHVIWGVRSITEQKNKELAYQQQLERLAEEAQQASKAKSDFLFNMSHDIRTPMNAIMGYSQLMKKELTDPKLLDYEAKIEHSGNLLLSIINNVLDMARIESGKVELDETFINMDEIESEIMSIFGETVTKKQLHITSDISGTRRHVLGDQTKIKEIFLNLISNAVKYTPDGGSVTIRSRELPCNEDGYVLVETVIEDNGIGMSEDYLPHLFDSFTRERNTTTGKVAGTGLGMPIVKKLVDLMGGTIRVESELGKGTRFTMVLRHKLADAQDITQQPVIDAQQMQLMQGSHFLLAEDNDLNAEIAAIMLEDRGITVDRAEDGIQCVAKMEQMPAGTYDMILMDIQMPNMDGYKAAQTIRQLKDPKKASIPILAMTANAFEEDRKNALAAGMNGHLSKPIDMNKAEQVICALLAEKEKQ
ncbi:MAG: ATP-binding protein [Clostridia bacterium]|nr:ATP-binding protein [Clostridia bacterium]